MLKASAPVRQAAGLTVALTLGSGCGFPVYRLPLDRCPSNELGTPGDHVSVQYLGVGGFLIRRGEDVLLTAPLYSNPSLIEYVLEHEIRPDTDLIDGLLPADAAQARAILSGHSHYDHLMDVPYVALHKAKQATVYGSTTTERLLAAVRDRPGRPGLRIESLDGRAWDNDTERAGEWIELSPTLRFTAIRSEHSDQVTLSLLGLEAPLHLGRGKLQHGDRTELPRRGSEWAEGSVFAYVIDFLDASRQVLFRIYYQDSGSNPPRGFLPKGLDGGDTPRPADLAIVCVGGDFRRLDDHPRKILLDTRPRYVVLAHWEDFFVTQRAYAVDRAVRGIPNAKTSFLKLAKSDTQVFFDRARRAMRELGSPEEPLLPCPTRSRFEFPITRQPR